MRKEPTTPQGTIVLMLIMLVIFLVLWGNVYFQMLGRGVTQ